MELKDLIKLFRNNSKTILFFSVIFAVIGIILFNISPKKYIATGSIYVGRKINEITEDHFTYEGYYGQQAAISYTNSVMGIIESENIRAMTLEDLSLPVKESTIRKLANKTNIKKAGPQIITVSIKDSNKESAKDLWLSMINATEKSTQKINDESDPFIYITKIDTQPLVRDAFSSIYINALIGFVTGFTISYIYFAFKKYLK